MDTPHKRCSRKEKCVHPEGQEGWLPATETYFGLHSRYKDGFRCACRACESNDQKERYSKNPEDKLKYMRGYNLNNREAKRDYNSRYYAQTAETQRADARRRRAENPERHRESDHRWRQNNPLKIRIKNRNREARESAASGTHTVTDIQAQHARQQGRCYYCGCELTVKSKLPNSATVDHVIPLSRGGSNAPDNLVIACQDCNFRKHNKLPHEWTEGGRLL